MEEIDSIFLDIPKKWRHEVKILPTELQVFTDHAFLPAVIPRAVCLDLVVCDCQDGKRITVHKNNLVGFKTQVVEMKTPKEKKVKREKKVPKALQYILGTGTIAEAKVKLGIV